MKKQKTQRKPHRVLKTICLVILLAVILYASGLIYPGGGLGKDVISQENTDWMSQISDDRPLSLINIPGTHDSGTRYIFPSYIFQDQNTLISGQLEHGYRYLDVRVALNKAGDDLIIVHAFGTCRSGAAIWSKALTYDSVVEDTLAFLDYYPSETVVFCVKPEHSGDDVDVVRELLEQKIAEDPDRWFTENRIPTLGEARGKIVLARRYDAQLGLNFNWDDQGDDTVLEDPVAVKGMDTFTLAVQDRYHYGVEDKWNAVRYALDNTAATEQAFCLNFLSTAQGKVPHPLKYARRMNSLFLSEELTAGSRYGVILFDFADAQLAQKVIDTNLIP